jgi:hypothetical protein
MALAARSERPGMGERYGVAVTASKLEIEVGKESSLDRICEMGYARIEMSAQAKDEAARIAGELAPWLWSAAYGSFRATSRVEACTRFTSWLLLRPYMAEINQVDRGIVQRFAECVVHEWLSLRCKACGGSGWQGVTDSGKRVHAASLGRSCVKAICLQCRGSGRPPSSPKLRIRSLSSPARKVGDGEYDKLWRRQFSLGHAALKEISERPRDHLRAMREAR